MANLDALERLSGPVAPVDMFDGFDSLKSSVAAQPEIVDPVAHERELELRRIQRELCARVLQLELTEAQALKRMFDETLLADGDVE